MEATLHHVGICAVDGEKMAAKLKSILGIKALASRKTILCKQWVLRGNGITVTITQRAPGSDSRFKPIYASEDWTVFCCNHGTQNKHAADSVFNVALRVKNVSAILDRCKQYQKERGDLCEKDNIILRNTTSVSDEFGTVKYAIIKSCVGNIVHTLIDDSEYTGIFLPGYRTYDMPSRIRRRPLLRLYSVRGINDRNTRTVNGIRRRGSLSQFVMPHSRPLNEDMTKTNNNLTNELVKSDKNLYNGIDHIALACEVGSYSTILEWYQKCMGFQRFLVNENESEQDGFIINMNEDVGMRLLAMEYWKCRENGIISAPCDPNARPFKLVLAESLTAGLSDQITAFIKAHGCPGVQHIALHCQNIMTARNRLQENGLEFLMTPKAYYYEEDIEKRIENIGLDWASLSQSGVLVDADEEGDDYYDVNNNLIKRQKSRYLLQIFTKPLFSKDTFFLELIERHGTEGFGAGNIPALWRTIRKYMEESKISM